VTVSLKSGFSRFLATFAICRRSFQMPFQEYSNQPTTNLKQQPVTFINHLNTSVNPVISA